MRSGFALGLSADAALSKDWRAEAGIDFLEGESTDDAYDSTIYGLRAHVQRRLFGYGQADGTYALAGLGMLSEQTEHLETGTTYSNSVGTVGLGIGTTFWSGRLDLRADYTLFISSSNVPGMFTTTLGLRF
jgi:hypothetical protein